MGMDGVKQRDLVYIVVAVEPMDDGEMYLRQNVLALTDENGHDVASVDTMAGLGGDLILMDWRGRRGKLRMSHILRQWVRSFDETGARRLPVTGPPLPEPPTVEPTPPAKGNFAAEVAQAMEDDGDD